MRERSGAETGTTTSMDGCEAHWPAALCYSDPHPAEEGADLEPELEPQLSEELDVPVSDFDVSATNSDCCWGQPFWRGRPCAWGCRVAGGLQLVLAAK